MSGPPSAVVAEHRLDRVAARMFTAAAGRHLAREADRHLAAGMPPIAVYAFDHVGRAVAQWGRYEREELELLMRALAGRLVPGGVCLDIGANVGNHALFFADHFDEVLAFEPHPRTFALLQFNAQLKPNVRCFDIGLSDRAGVAQLSVPAGNAGMATLHGDAGVHGAATVATAPCRLERADDLPALQGRHVALMKVDVEGHEAAVLRGARALLARDRPVVVFEQTEAGIAGGTSPTLELLRESGYTRLWTLQALPPHRGPRVLTLLRRLLFGESIQLVECRQLERRFHGMVVALPA
jgi:FkbM family methyltransferase